MCEEVVADTDRKGFTCPAELLIRGVQEENTDYIIAFLKAADTCDDRILNLLGNILLKSDDDVARICTLRTLVQIFPEDSSRLIQSIIEDGSDELGCMAARFVTIGASDRESIMISDDVLERLALSKETVLRKRALTILSSMISIKSDELLIELLDDTESPIRREAASCLGERACQSALSSLRKLLDDSDESVRESVVVALAKLRDSSAVPYARDLLKGDLNSSLSGIEALCLLGEISASEVMDLTIEKLSCMDNYIFCDQAGWMIDRVLDDSVLETVIELAGKDDGIGQMLAYECIWMFDDKRINDLVLKEAESSSASTQILDYLPRLSDPKALDLILEQFDRGILPDREALERLHSIVLRNISEDDVSDQRIRNRLKEKDTQDRILTALFAFYAKLRLIENQLSSRGRYHNYEKHIILKTVLLLGASITWRLIDVMLKDPSNYVRMEAALAYADIEADPALEAMEKFLKITDDTVFRWETAGHIAELRGNRKLDALIEILEKEDEEIMWPVIEILGYLRNPDGVQPLSAMLEHGDWWIQASAARALGMIGDSSVKNDLHKLLDDECEYVRFRAKEALDRIGMSC